MRFQLTNNDVPRPLDELIAENELSDGPEHVVVEGRDLVRFMVSVPSKGSKNRGYVEIFLDPEYGHLARRVVVHVNDAGNGKSHDLVRRVTDFKGFGNGVYFPVSVETQGIEDYVSRCAAVNVVVNEPLPEDALNFTFPENCLVQYLPPDASGHVRVAIWGSNNKPVRDILPEEQAKAQADAQPREAIQESSRSALFIAINAAVIVILSILVWRRFAVAGRG